MKRTIWSLNGGMAAGYSTFVDLQRQTHGLQLMRDELVVPRDRSAWVVRTFYFFLINNFSAHKS